MGQINKEKSGGNGKDKNKVTVNPHVLAKQDRFTIHDINDNNSIIIIK